MNSNRAIGLHPVNLLTESLHLVNLNVNHSSVNLFRFFHPFHTKKPCRSKVSKKIYMLNRLRVRSRNRPPAEVLRAVHSVSRRIPSSVISTFTEMLSRKS